MDVRILLFLFAFVPSQEKVRWVAEGGTLKVDGTTNVNKFSCQVKDYNHPDTLTFYTAPQPVLMSGCVKLPVMGFDCMNGAMTDGLRKALNAKDFPRLSITFLSLEKYPALKSAEENIRGMVNIEMAGVSKKIAVNYRILMDDQQVIHLIGNQTILFTSFGLTPPRKLGGMIRANDQLQVEFHISFKVIYL
jgi:hypothetical protein